MFENVSKEIEEIIEKGILEIFDLLDPFKEEENRKDDKKWNGMK